MPWVLFQPSPNLAFMFHKQSIEQCLICSCEITFYFWRQGQRELIGIYYHIYMYVYMNKHIAQSNVRGVLQSEAFERGLLLPFSVPHK